MTFWPHIDVKFPFLFQTFLYFELKGVMWSLPESLLSSEWSDSEKDQEVLAKGVSYNIPVNERIFFG